MAQGPKNGSAPLAAATDGPAWLRLCRASGLFVGFDLSDPCLEARCAPQGLLQTARRWRTRTGAGRALPAVADDPLLRPEQREDGDQGA